MRSNTSVNGYVLFEETDFVVIATLKSENEKTGNMIQIWIMNRHVSPVEAVKTGADNVVCFDCPMRGTDGFTGRICYVNVAQGPRAVWQSYQDGNYPVLPMAEYGRVFGGRAVRFGAYGEPVLIPVSIVREIVRCARKHTGYTHQFRRPEFQMYREFLMASCDAAADYELAHAMGWRTFRVRSKSDAILAGEISCPASDEMGKRTTCEKCGLCNGSKGAIDSRKSIVIFAHGIGAKNFVSLASIAAA